MRISISGSSLSINCRINDKNLLTAYLNSVYTLGLASRLYDFRTLKIKIKTAQNTPKSKKQKTAKMNPDYHKSKNKD
jgi:hypothetical protein